MKFKIESKLLKEAARRCFPLIPVKSPIRIVSGYRFDVYRDKLRVTGSDFSANTLTVDIPVTYVSGEPDCVYPDAAKMKALLDKLPDCELTMEIAGKELCLSFDGGTYKMSGAENFDNDRKYEYGGDTYLMKTRCPAEMFFTGLGNVFFGATMISNHDENKEGVHVLVSDGKMIFDTTCEQLLARETVNDPVIQADGDFILPLKGVKLMLSAANYEGNVTLTLYNTKFSIEGDGWIFWTTPAKLRFPDCGNVLNKLSQVEPVFQASIDRDMLRKVAKCMDTVPVDDDFKVSLTGEENSLKISVYPPYGKKPLAEDLILCETQGKFDRVAIFGDTLLNVAKPGHAEMIGFSVYKDQNIVRLTSDDSENMKLDVLCRTLIFD